MHDFISCIFLFSMIHLSFFDFIIVLCFFCYVKRKSIRVFGCSCFLFTLQPHTSYRYGLPVPVSSLHRDERSLSQQDGLLFCILLGAMVSYVEIC